MGLGCPLLLGLSDRRLRRCAATVSLKMIIFSTSFCYIVVYQKKTLFLPTRFMALFKFSGEVFYKKVLLLNILFYISAILARELKTNLAVRSCCLKLAAVNWRLPNARKKLFLYLLNRFYDRFF